MKRKFFQGSPNEILGSRCQVYLPNQNKNVWGYILSCENNYYRVLIEATGEYVRTKYVIY